MRAHLTSSNPRRSRYRTVRKPSSSFRLDFDRRLPLLAPPTEFQGCRTISNSHSHRRPAAAFEHAARTAQRACHTIRAVQYTTRCTPARRRHSATRGRFAPRFPPELSLIPSLSPASALRPRTAVPPHQTLAAAEGEELSCVALRRAGVPVSKDRNLDQSSSVGRRHTVEPGQHALTRRIQYTHLTRGISSSSRRPLLLGE